MLLETITGPGDLRELDEAELEQLAGEIRAFVVQSVSVTGGHLGSNLGVVELPEVPRPGDRLQQHPDDQNLPKSRCYQ